MAGKPQTVLVVEDEASIASFVSAYLKNAGYTVDTLTPVAGLAQTAEVLTVQPSLKVGSVAELVRLAKSEPGVLRYGSAGVGTLPHIEGELLKTRTGIARAGPFARRA